MKEVFNYIDRNKKKLVSLTKKLISIPTVNPPGKNYEEIAGFLDRYCKGLGLRTKKVITPRNELKKYNIKGGSKRINLIAEWDTGGKKTLNVSGHYDVVPVTGNWKTDAFRPVTKAGRIYGRGATDMKGDIACALIAIEALKKCNVIPGCNIQLCFTPDEETGGRTGLGYLVKEGTIKPDYAFSEGYHSDHICYGNKGIMWLKIEVFGRSCHSSEPYKGINAFEKMIAVSNELMRLKERIQKRTTGYRTKNRKDRHATFVMGGEFWGGHKTNVVPDKATFMIDRRLLPEENIDEAYKEIIDTIERLKKKDRELNVKVHLMSSERPAVYKGDSRLYGVFKDSIRKVLRKEATAALLAGATDMRFLIRKGIPCAGYSADGGNTCHCDDEYVKIKSLINTTKVYASVMANL